jgi:hypothetical protein
MKRAFLLIVIPALLVALGFAQTPAASTNTDQTTIKGCLGGADGNYTVVQDNTGHTFKITTSGVDLKAHLGHDVSLIGHRASGTSSAAADNSFAVAELTMISEHCAAAAAAAAAPAATTTSTLPETAIKPAAPATAPAATVTATPETVVTPAAAATAPAATVTATPETVVTPAVAATAPAATVTATPETVVTPAAPTTEPAATVTTTPETVVTPAVAATAPAATVTTPTETVVTPAATAITVSDKPAVDAAPPTGRPDRFRSLSAAPVAAAVTPAATASKSSKPASTPDAAATTPAAPVKSSETVTTPDAAPTTPPPAPARHGTLWLLIGFAVVVILLGIFVPSLNRWRKQKSLAGTDAPNLSFTREAPSDQDKPDEPRKVA